MSTADWNPYEVASSAQTPFQPAPGWEWASVAGERVVLAFTLAVPSALAAGVAAADAFGTGREALAIAMATAVVGVAMVVPTTLVTLDARLLRPGTDPRAIQVHGRQVSRRAYRRWRLAEAVEHGLLGLPVALCGVGIALSSPYLLPIGAVLVTVGSWFVYRAAVGARTHEATIAEAAGDPARVVNVLRPLLRLPLQPRVHTDGLRVAIAWAEARCGDVDQALTTLAEVRFAEQVGASVLEARLRLGRGERGPAQLLLRERVPGSAAERRALAVLRAIDGIYANRPETTIEVTTSARRVAFSSDRALWDELLLAHVAALVMQGHPLVAHTALRASGVDLEARAWMAEVWPRWWELIQSVR